MDDRAEGRTAGAEPERRVRADVRRNNEALLKAALAVFACSGVDAPVREIAEAAGVGMGTIYRHFPQRSDLIVAVFRREVESCADAAPALAGAHGPGEALERWLVRFADFIMAKRGLAAALHSGDPAYDGLPKLFDGKLRPALEGLLDAAVAAGEVRADIAPGDLLRAVACLCTAAGDAGPEHARRMAAVFVDGLRYGAGMRTVPRPSIADPG